MGFQGFGGGGVLGCQSFGAVWVPGFGAPVFQCREAGALEGRGLVVLRFEGAKIQACQWISMQRLGVPMSGNGGWGLCGARA